MKQDKSLLQRCGRTIITFFNVLSVVPKYSAPPSYFPILPLPHQQPGVRCTCDETMVECE